MGSTQHSTVITASFPHLHTLQVPALLSKYCCTHSGNCCRVALFRNSECCGSHVITAILRFLGSDYHYPQHPRHCNNAIPDNNVTHLIWNCSSGCIEPTQYFYLLSTGNTHFDLYLLNSIVDCRRRDRRGRILLISRLILYALRQNCWSTKITITIKKSPPTVTRPPYHQEVFH